jgi:hypothetical protein
MRLAGMLKHARSSLRIAARRNGLTNRRAPVRRSAMQHDCLQRWTQSHEFRHGHASGECRTTIVLAPTIVVTAVEIAAGHVFNLMALPADGLHMGTHA